MMFSRGSIIGKICATYNPPPPFKHSNFVGHLHPLHPLILEQDIRAAVVMRLAHFLCSGMKPVKLLAMSLPPLSGEYRPLLSSLPALTTLLSGCWIAGLAQWHRRFQVGRWKRHRDSTWTLATSISVTTWRRPSSPQASKMEAKGKTSKKKQFGQASGRSSRMAFNQCRS